MLFMLIICLEIFANICEGHIFFSNHRPADVINVDDPSGNSRLCTFFLSFPSKLNVLT